MTFLRALAHEGFTHVPGFRDPSARPLLSRSWAWQLERMARRPRRGVAFELASSAADLLALRTMAIDAALSDALGRGVRQVVLLGAGFDGRAFRMPELAGADVYEVDRAETQELKRERAAALTRSARSLRFVSVDFERGSLGAALAEAGHREGEPTAWIWEGVVMYLSTAALRSTLRVIAERSAPASTSIVEYHTPARQSLARRLLLGVWGEPLIGLRPREEMAAELAAVGLRVAEDTGTAEWAQRWGAPMPSYDGAKRVRIVVATR